jgi:uncharacterized membrane protein YeaQ/YmgE (transglycosylase-associated protein family)
VGTTSEDARKVDKVRQIIEERYRSARTWDERKVAAAIRKCYGKASRRVLDKLGNPGDGDVGKLLRPSLPMLHIIWYIILGFLAGLIARLILHTHLDFLLTILLGIAGSIVGGLIARLFSRPRDGALFHPAGLILSIIGSLVVLFVFNKVGPHYHWNQLLH